MLLRLCSLLMTAAAALALAAQTPAPPAPPSNTPYHLQTTTRLVLTDVLVFDKAGRPVHNLPPTAFHLTDDGHPEVLSSFAEHTGSQAPPPEAAAPGTFSNDFLAHPPPAMNVVLLDLTTIGITDQMVLAQQLKNFVASVAPQSLVAIYTRAGDRVVPLAQFTADHTLLSAAFHKAIPRLQQPGSWAASDIDTLQQMIELLRPYPGRKNLIWFTGGSNAALLADASQLPIAVDMRPLYDALEASRIAVYPVSARGLTTYIDTAQIFQQLMMNETAESTGGRAYYNTNGLAQAATRVLQDGSDFYTLTYNPHESKIDNRWHKVRVAVDGNYTLSYRRGYFDDGSHLASTPGTLGTASTGHAVRPGQPDVLKPALLFNASILPAVPGTQPISALPSPPPGKHQQSYFLHYTLPASSLVQTTRDGHPTVSLGVGVLAFNRVGAQIVRQGQSVSIGIDPDKLRLHPDGTISVNQGLNLPHGDLYLYVVVWDEISGRLGTVQLPVTVH